MKKYLPIALALIALGLVGTSSSFAQTRPDPQPNGNAPSSAPNKPSAPNNGASTSGPAAQDGGSGYSGPSAR